jgi:hypothetical protein
MHPPSRPPEMPDLEWLCALEEIRQLKARRDRYLDAHDWDAYQALHAPDHVSHHAPDHQTGVQAAPWTSAADMVANVRRIMTDQIPISAHHSYDPEIVFETRSRARGLWAMTAASVSRGTDGRPAWLISYGYYDETYEKRGGEWLFTSRRWQRYFGAGSAGVLFPLEPVRGSQPPL